MTTTPVLFVLQGLPGSGKSTKAREILEANPDQRYVRVNRDTLRDMAHFGRTGEKDKEAAISIIKFATIEALLAEGYSVISDDTNFRKEPLDKLKDIARRQKAAFILHRVNTPLEECIKRDAKRDGPARVGEAVIRRFYDDYLAGAPTEREDVIIAGPKQVTIDLRDDETEALEYLAQEQGITHREANRQAISQAKYFLKRRKEGWKVLLQKPDDVREVYFR